MSQHHTGCISHKTQLALLTCKRMPDEPVNAASCRVPWYLHGRGRSRRGCMLTIFSCVALPVVRCWAAMLIGAAVRLARVCLWQREQAPWKGVWVSMSYIIAASIYSAFRR